MSVLGDALAGKAVRVGDTVLLTSVLSLKANSPTTTWFIAPGVEVLGLISLADAVKLVGWKVIETLPAGG